ncbi:general secretion pathway protein GspN [Luteimonas terrae]|uniref:General secretion pathway protein GspN n=1 Tax=Luteimonas terrae TaxID=1530191 RepID=A0A4R5UF70_9GAMM|nr:general secretion pathway protein GspN [Luteimonas terrae]TDK33984.1 general secretion pathway protein GspN [Luteimonas terrae]
MRIDATNARTWLTAAVGSWALLFALLALAGLGSRLGTPEDDGSAAAPVGPAPAEVAPAPPLSAFGEVAARPLFTSDRRPQPFFIDPQDEGEGGNGFDYVLTSVLRTPDFALAILQPSGGGDSIRLKIGEAPPEASNWLLDSVDTRSVVFNTPEGPRTLELRVFDGTGGQPPTPMTPVPSPDGRPAAQAASRPPPTPEQAARAAQQTADAAARAAPGTGTQSGSAQAGSSPGRQASAVPGSSATAETAPSAGPSEAQVEAIRRRIEERRARLRQQQQQPSTSPTQ